MMAEYPPKVMKFFFAVEVSRQMGEERLNAVNRALAESREELARLQEGSGVVFEMAVLAVGQEAKWHCLPTPADALKPEPLAVGRGLARWAEALCLLNKDLTRSGLMKAGGPLLVPSIFFVAGGRPAEEADALRKAAEELKENRWYKHFRCHILLAEEDPAWAALARKLTPDGEEDGVYPIREKGLLGGALQTLVIKIAQQAVAPRGVFYPKELARQLMAEYLPQDPEDPDEDYFL